MKKIVFFFILFACLGGYLVQRAYSQRCTPNRNACTPKLACLSPEAPPVGTVGEPYNLDLQIVVAEKFDTVFQGRNATVRFREIRIDSIRKIPRGLSINLYSGNPADNTQGGKVPIPGRLTPGRNPAQIFACGAIFGTPTEPTGPRDTMMIYVMADLDVTLQGLPISIPLNNQPFSFPYPIIIKAPALTVEAGPDAEIMCGESVVLKARANQADVRYIWNPTTGLDNPFSPTPTARPTTTTIYTVTVTNGRETAGAKVTVKVLPPDFRVAFSASVTNFNAPPFTTTFTNLTPNPERYQFFWSLGDGTTSTLAGPITHTYRQNGEYTVTLIAKLKDADCADTLTKQSYIICKGGASNLVVDAGSDFAITCGESRTLRATCNVTQNVTFEWNPTQGLDNPTILNPLAAPRQTTTYTLIARSGNLKAIDSVTVTVIPIAQPTITESGGILTANVSGVGTIVRYTWYRDGSPIAGANNATYQPLAPGIFTVEIENEKGCRSISEPFEFKITSLEQGLFLEGHRLWIYPNPTTGTFAIQTTYPSSYSIRVIDALGKVILYSNATSSNIQQFDLSSFANGVYYIHLQTIAGNKIITKLVKH